MDSQIRIFDYVIVGAGAAGLQLAMAMIEDPFFNNRQILIVEKDQKNANDRTWCFWEKGEGKWDHVVTKSWEKGKFITTENTRPLDIFPYRYKMIKSLDFYNYCRNAINASGRIQWLKSEVINIIETNGVTVVCMDATIHATHVFDSRINEDFFKADNSVIKILQHFKGWEIRTESNVFNPSEFVMMDFRVKLDNHTGFMYVLPSDEHTALVEFTLFTENLINDDGYDALLKKYIREILKIEQFEIIHHEYGVIPMTNYPFQKLNTSAVTKIGTAGGWVKPSSGYSFKNAERFSKIIIDNLKKNIRPSHGVASKHHRKYDTLLLEILKNQNHLGEEIFSAMYLKNPASKIFKFLDEETNFIEDINLIRSFKSAPFRKAFMKRWRELIRN